MLLQNGGEWRCLGRALWQSVSAGGVSVSGRGGREGWEGGVVGVTIMLFSLRDSEPQHCQIC